MIKHRNLKNKPYLIEFMAPYTNKGYAVKELCSYLQINMDDVYTIGDRKLIYLCLIPR
jgi:hydroxymethylpyrimidine pyrophosphatase-like HAD family hydrolase